MGKVLLGDTDIQDMETDERSKQGLFQRQSHAELPNQ